ncbi:MAG TPA: hypothetical protein VK749_15925 [Xanthobacteraceae bacterium]|jgi:hypothetical protein|nr:hypothetical protein [Xanthobacteraceae bacterium]
MTPGHMDFFMVSVSSSFESGGWIVYEVTAPDKVLFVGAREAAEFDADRRNQEAQKAYREASHRQWVDGMRGAVERDTAAMIGNFTKYMEERFRKEETLGLSNIVALCALSLPA